MNNQHMVDTSPPWGYPRINTNTTRRIQMEWGREIEVNGQCPAWLRATDIVDLKTSFGWRYPHVTEPSEVPPQQWTWRHDDGVVCITHIRLHADHWAYMPLDAGFEPWAGGSEQPKDFAGGSVMFRSGIARSSLGIDWTWGHQGGDKHWDIVGYERAPAVLTSPVQQAELYWRFTAATEARPASPEERRIAELITENNRLTARLAEITRKLATDSTTGTATPSYMPGVWYDHDRSRESPLPVGTRHHWRAGKRTATEFSNDVVCRGESWTGIHSFCVVEYPA